MESEKVKEIKKALEERTQHKPINCCNAEYVEACGMYCRHHREFVAHMGSKTGQTCKNCSNFIATDEVKEYADILTLINELESENERLKKDCADIANDYQEMGGFYYEEAQKNQQLKDKVTELESENKELRVVVDIANERTYRKKFTDEWRKEYQKELDKQGNGHIAGHPDFDLVYKLYFEQKERIAELEEDKEKWQRKAVNYYQRAKSYGIECIIDNDIDETLKEYKK